MFSVVQDWQLITCNGASSKLFIKTFKFIIWTIFINVSNQRPDINILISTFKCMYCIAEIDQVKLCPNYKINRRGFKYVQTSYKIIHCSLQGSWFLCLKISAGFMATQEPVTLALNKHQDQRKWWHVFSNIKLPQAVQASMNVHFFF